MNSYNYSGQGRILSPLLVTDGPKRKQNNKVSVTNTITKL